MTDNGRVVRWRPPAIGEWWQGFWFRPEPTYTLGLVRIAFGALAVLWTLWLLPILHDMLGPHGVVPDQHEPAIPGNWGVFEVVTSDRAILIGWAVLLASAVALTLGWHSRVAAVLVFVLILSFLHRDLWVFNAGDSVVRIMALFVALSPCGTALSLDQRRRTGTFWSAQSRPIWALRLMQVQLSIIYLSSVLIKLTGQTWPQGTAVSYALRLVDMQRLPSPEWITTNALLMNAATWAALATELAIGVLVWNRQLRPWVLAAGVVMHLTIDIGIIIGIFSYAMFVLYLAWVPPDTVKRLPGTVKRAVTRSLARLGHRRSKSPTDSRHRRVEIPALRSDQDGSRSAVFDSADAVNGHEHMAADVDFQVHARTPVVTTGANNGELATPGGLGSDKGAVSWQ
jgi:Vitamin K-dependent gamma-carboxylase